MFKFMRVEMVFLEGRADIYCWRPDISGGESWYFWRGELIFLEGRADISGGRADISGGEG